MEAASPPLTIKIQKPKLHDRSLYGSRGWTSLHDTGEALRAAAQGYESIDIASGTDLNRLRRPS